MECGPGSNKVRARPKLKLRWALDETVVSLNMKRTTDVTKSSISPGAGHFAHIVAPDALFAAGKALRDKIPREQHGRWNEIKGRRDTIDLLRKSDIGRMKKLIPIRYGRMLPSPFTFYRGAAGVMAADLARTPTTGLRVQACGDCHLVNFGGFATPERSIIFDINDFDETLPGPWEWDVKRLVASIVLAARSNGLSDHRGRDCAVNCARRYREHMREFAKMDDIRGEPPFVFAIQGSGELRARALRREKHIRPSRAARRDGTTPDAAGLGHFPRLGHRTQRATARCQDQAFSEDVRCRDVGRLCPGMRLGARSRSCKGQRDIGNDHRVSWFFERCVRRSNGKTS
jgi:Uncharacterized protein conserved in bacteria (DUF2252)